eukprot:4547789-Prymnesium_polylepis.1
MSAHGRQPTVGATSELHTPAAREGGRGGRDGGWPHNRAWSMREQRCAGGGIRRGALCRVD